MANDSLKARTVVFSNRKMLNTAMRQAISELKYPGSKRYCEKLADCIDVLSESEDETLVILDWDIGVGDIMRFFSTVASHPSKENWAIALIASEQSDKIIAAGAENNVAKVHTGPINVVKAKLILEELLKEIKQALPLKSVFRSVVEARNQGDWKTAAKLLTELMTTEKDNRRVAYELGESYLQMNQAQECYDMLEPILQETPPDTRILHVAAKALIKLKRRKEAIDLLEKAEVINPHNVQRLVDFGNILLNERRLREASEKFGKAVSLDDDNKDAIKGVSTCKMVDGDVNEALRLLKGNVTGTELASIFNTAAIISSRQDNFEKGIGLYEVAEQSLQGRPKILAKIAFNKGLSFYHWGKLDDARRCFEQACALDPTFTKAAHNLNAISVDTESVDNVKVSNIPEVSEVVEETAVDLFDDNLEGEDERL